MWLSSDIPFPVANKSCRVSLLTFLLSSPRGFICATPTFLSFSLAILSTIFTLSVVQYRETRSLHIRFLVS